MLVMPLTVLKDAAELPHPQEVLMQATAHDARNESNLLMGVSRAPWARS